MSYPEMQRSIDRVNATRAERVKQVIPRLSAEDKKALLESYHPDFRPSGMRTIRVGPNRGDRAVNEFVDVLEAHPRVAPDRIDLGQVDQEVDVLVIGGGGGGSTAALLAHDAGREGAARHQAPPRRLEHHHGRGGHRRRHRAGRLADAALPRHHGRRPVQEHPRDGDDARHRGSGRRRVAGEPRGHVRPDPGRPPSSRTRPAGTAGSAPTPAGTSPGSRSCACCGTRSAAGPSRWSSSAPAVELLPRRERPLRRGGAARPRHQAVLHREGEDDHPRHGRHGPASTRSSSRPRITTAPRRTDSPSRTAPGRGSPTWTPSSTTRRAWPGPSRCSAS